MTAPLLTRPIVRHFIAGYTDLTPLEFATHYRSELNYALASGGYFILSDEPGTCNMAFAHLLAHGVPTSQITIYCSTTSPARGERPYDNSEFSVVEVEGGETERYEAMARVSCKGSIIWLRDGEELGVDDGEGCVRGEV